MPFFKKTALRVLAFLLISSIIAPLVFGKTALENAKDDYTFQFTKYQEAKAKYLQNKAAYEKFKTATSKNDAFIATKDYLTQVDNLYFSYFQLVIEKGNEIDWSNAQDKRDKTVSLINEEISFVNDHKNKVLNTKTLEELPPLANALSAEVKVQTLPKLYKVLSLYELVETKSSLANLTLTGQEVEKYLEINPIQNRSVEANWKSEIENIKSRAGQNILSAEKTLEKTLENTAKENQFEEISASANSAKTNIKRSGKLFDEIMNLL